MSIITQKPDILNLLYFILFILYPPEQLTVIDGGRGQETLIQKAFFVT